MIQCKKRAVASLTHAEFGCAKILLDSFAAGIASNARILWAGRGARQLWRLAGVHIIFGRPAHAASARSVGQRGRDYSAVKITARASKVSTDAPGPTSPSAPSWVKAKSRDCPATVACILV